MPDFKPIDIVIRVHVPTGTGLTPWELDQRMKRELRLAQSDLHAAIKGAFKYAAIDASADWSVRQRDELHKRISRNPPGTATDEDRRRQNAARQRAWRQRRRERKDRLLIDRVR